MELLFTFFAITSSVNPIYLVMGFDNSPIYSVITNHSLYPECPSNLSRYLVKDYTQFNMPFIKNYANCVSKLLQVQFNKSTGKVEQLPGISSYSSPFCEYPFIPDAYKSIINNLQQIGYQVNHNLFIVRYNHFLHPISSYPVYDKLKNDIEQKYQDTYEKSIIISIDEGSSFTSIFVSNYTKVEWVKRYIESVIFLSPTFSGFPTLSKLITQNMPPFTSNAEFKKSLMRMPGIHLSLPNYAIFENFTIDTKTNKKFHNSNASHAFEFLKEIGKVDDETETIFKTTVENFLKVPVPEPPIPSIIIFNEKTAKTTIKPIISINEDDRHEESVAMSVRYSCSHWKTAKCIKTNKPSQTIFECVNGRIFQSSKSIKEKILVKDEINLISSIGVTGIYAESGYVTSHTIDSSKFTYSGPEGKPNYPLSNAFDTSSGAEKTYYVSSMNNSDTFNNTLEITFNEAFSLEAILYDTSYSTSGGLRSFHGFPKLLYVYTSLANSEYKLFCGFTGNEINPSSWSRMQFVFPRYTRCDKLKLEFVEVSNQSMKNAGGPAPNVAIAGLIFIRHLFISSESYHTSVGYLNTHIVNSSEFSFGGSEGMVSYPLSNAFDEDSATYYISNVPNSETFNNYIEITFKKTETIEAFLYDPVKLADDVVFQGLPTRMNIYSSVGGSQYTFLSAIEGQAMINWTTICYHLVEPTQCDKIKIEFVEVTSQTISGNSTSPVIAELRFIRFMNEILYVNTNFTYSSNAYLNEYSIPTSKFTYDGFPAKAGYSLSNAFDGDPSTLYISELANNETFNNVITISFTETVSIEDIVFDVSYVTSTNGVRSYYGYPKIINIYTSLGNEPFTLNNIFTGKPNNPRIKFQLHFPKVFQCDKLKMEFADVALQQVSSLTPDKNLIIGSLYFISPHSSDVIQYSEASGLYNNDTYVNSIAVNRSEFSFNAAAGLAGYSESYLFDKNASTVYISSVQNNLTYQYEIEFTFNETISLEAFLIDPFVRLNGNIALYRGFPTGIKVYSSLGNEEYTLNTFFVGEPIEYWPRIQCVFPKVLTCDKLKFKFVHITLQFDVGTIRGRNLAIRELYFLHSQIILPSPTPSVTPSFTPSSSVTPSCTPSSSPSFTPSSSPSFTPSSSPSFTPSSSPSFIPSFSPSSSPSFTPSFSPSSAPSSSPSFTPSPSSSVSPSFYETPEFIPTQIPIENICILGTHCTFEGNENNSVLVTIENTVFNDIQNKEDGGAILINNAGMSCTSIKFNGCHTNSGRVSGGGGIYIKNEIEMNNPITLISVNFTNCIASYGGAAFIYSKFEESKVTIRECFFASNQATMTSTTTSINGGSAIYISSKNSIIIDCSFLKNIGESQLKMQNVFDDTNELSLLHTSQKTTNIIIYCRFEIDRHIKSSLYYFTGENGVHSYVRNCVFVGDLYVGNYHINGKAVTKFTPKLSVERCKFSSNYIRAFNTEAENQYLLVAYQQQTFEYKEKKESHASTISGIVLFVFVAILAVVAIIVFKKMADTKNIANQIK